MPKKMGLNSKAVESRERKAATKKATQDRKAREAEDNLWVDHDKNLAKKQQRRDDEERKRADLIRRKAESKAMLEEEMSSIKTRSKLSQTKVVRQQIVEEIEKKQQAPLPSTNVVAPYEVLEENLNYIMADTSVATNVDEALAVLSVNNEKEDKHPERRMRAAYRAFEDANLPRIKSENPHLRLSQWKQMIMKEWNKSPDNPFNQIN